MVVKVHCGTVLGDEFAVMLKVRPPKPSHNALSQPSLPGLLRTTWLWKCIVGLFLGTNLQPCWKCFPQNRPTMHFNNLEPGLPGNLKSASVPTTNGMQKTPSITQDLNLTNRQWTSHLSWEFLRVEADKNCPEHFLWMKQAWDYLFLSRSNKKGKTWSCGTNYRKRESFWCWTKMAGTCSKAEEDWGE